MTDSPFDGSPASQTPPPAYPYPWPYPPAVPPAPPAPRRGIMSGITRLGGVFSMVLVIFLFGFYAAIFSIAGGSGLTPATYHSGKGKERIAILPVSGMIQSDTVSYVHAAVESILKDPSIRAVVLRVQSPGGGAAASDQILHEINRLRTERNLPIVASYGDYAASGGYYISCQSDFIYAEPTTLTGSIGVIGTAFTLHQMLDKWGIEPKIVTSTAAVDKDTGSMFRAWEPKDYEKMRYMLDYVQARFVEVVYEGRKNHMTQEQVVAIATGAGLMAADAKRDGLVDEIGYLDAALEKARTLGSIVETDPPVVYFRPKTSVLEMLGVTSRTPPTSLSFDTLLDARVARQWMDELAVPRVMYLHQP